MSNTVTVNILEFVPCVVECRAPVAQFLFVANGKYGRLQDRFPVLEVRLVAKDIYIVRNPSGAAYLYC